MSEEEATGAPASETPASEAPASEASDSDADASGAGSIPTSESGGQPCLHPDRSQYRELVETLRSEGYWMCTDLCAVDYLDHAARRSLPAGVAPQRFEVVANLLDPTQRRRVRIRVQVPEDDPVIDSISAVHPGVDFHERETWDLFGISFEGHPHLSRILLPDEWAGHPLRKDYLTGSIPVQFKAAGSAR